MNISPSQLQTWNSCPRQWWFKHVRKMPTPAGKSRALAFGTVFHGVAERYLLADDRGIDPETGKPVDLYPPGWEYAVERDGSKTIINTDDRALVKSLIADAVSRSVLRRLPGRHVEQRVETWVMPDVTMVMVMDQRNHEVVEDHKTPGRRDYAMGPAKLARDAKSLCYAMDQLRTYPEESKDGVRLRLNQACKDTKEKTPTWATETVVPAADVEAFWDQQVIPTAKEMVDLASRNLADEDWPAVEGPREDDACTKYDGCPFQSICDARKTPPAQYRARMSAPLHKPRSQQATERGPETMGMFKPLKPAAPAPAAPAASTPAPKVDTLPQVPTPPTQPPQGETVMPTPAAATTPPPQAVRVAPWARKECPACKGTGINSKNNPCAACDKHTETFKTGIPRQKDFRVFHDEKGLLQWEANQITPAPVAVMPNMTEQKAGQANPSDLTVIVPLTPAGAIDVAKMQAEAGAVPLPEATAPAKKTRAKKGEAVALQPVNLPETMKAAAMAVAQPGFVLYVNAIPLGQDYVDLLDVLHREGADLAGEKGASSFYELDSFKRRDMLAAKAATVAKEFEGKNVVALGSGQDLKHYVEALRPLARFVVVPVF